MDGILSWVRGNAGKILAIPAVIGGMEFVINLLSAASDGIITREELHQLVALASPSQVILIGVVMLALKNGK